MVSWNRFASVILISVLVVLTGCNTQTNERKATGTVEADTVVLSAETGGIIKEIVKEGSYVKVGDGIAKVESATLDAQLAQAQASQRGAEARLSESKASGATDDAVEVAQAGVDQANAAVQQVQILVDKTTIKSPVEGVVQTTVVKAGEFVGPGIVLVKVATNQWHLQIYIPEKNLADFSVGKVIHLQAEAIPNVVFDGTVDQINSTGEFTPKNVSTSTGRENLVYGVKVSVPNHESVRPGMALIATW